MTRSDKRPQNNKKSSDTPRRPTPIFPETQTQTNNSRRSEVIRNLQERVPGLHVPNYIEIIDDDEDTEPRPVRNTINTPMSPEEG